MKVTDNMTFCSCSHTVIRFDRLWVSTIRPCFLDESRVPFHDVDIFSTHVSRYICWKSCDLQTTQAFNYILTMKCFYCLPGNFLKQKKFFRSPFFDLVISGISEYVNVRLSFKSIWNTFVVFVYMEYDAENFWKRGSAYDWHEFDCNALNKCWFCIVSSNRF